jgi:hypothetical protein
MWAIVLAIGLTLFVSLRGKIVVRFLIGGFETRFPGTALQLAVLL